MAITKRATYRIEEVVVVGANVVAVMIITMTSKMVENATNIERGEEPMSVVLTSEDVVVVEIETMLLKARVEMMVEEST